MTYKIELSQEQLDDLETVLRRELRESKAELHHTWDADYKQHVRRHIEMVASTIEAVESAGEKTAAKTMPR